MATVAIRPEVEELRAEIVENRRHFHAHPELSFQEHKTAAHVAELLRSYGITEVWEGVGRTGVVAVITGGRAGPCIALRADMDALPLEETATVSYRSTAPGVMHACGHDGHMAGLLAVARILQGRRAGLAGSVKLLFQPAEEGFGGAREMIAAGCLEGDRGLGPPVAEVYGLHLWSYDPLGTTACDHGPVMAASDKFAIAVCGVGGHGAAPRGTVDAIVEAAALVTALQTIVSRSVDPCDAAVVTCGSIRGGSGYNIIADRVDILGTCRSFRPDTQELIISRMGEVCAGVATTYGGEVKLDYTKGYPATVNAHPAAVERVRRIAAAVVGAGNERRPQRTCGAEDFSYFLQARPGAFFFVGAALPGPARPHHKSVFDFDEESILVGASIFLGIVDDLIGPGAASVVAGASAS